MKDIDYLEENKKIHNTTVAIILTGIFLIAVIIGLPVRMLTLRILKNNNEVAAKNQAYSEELDNLTTLRKLNKDYQKIKQKADNILKVLPEESDLTNYVLYLENRAGATGNKVINISIVSSSDPKNSSKYFPATQKGDIFILSTDIEIEGGYNNLVNFTREVNKIAPISQIYSLSTNYDDDKKVLNTKITVRTFFKPSKINSQVKPPTSTSSPSTPPSSGNSNNKEKSI